MQELTQLISTLGFPIVCCGFYMLKMEKTLAENTRATQEISRLISVLLEREDRKNE